MKRGQLSGNCEGRRAAVFVKGVRDTASFTTKAQAQVWAAQRETELRTMRNSKIVPRKTVEEAFRRYELDVSRQKRGYRWEALRLGALVETEIDGVRFGAILLSQLSASHIAPLRDIRLQAVLSSTVNRELNLVSHVLSTAVKEWKWPEESPEERTPAEGLAKKLNVLARMAGHRNLRMLQVYYNESASEIAKRLDEPR